MSVLIIKNILSEGPGTIADHLRESGIPSRVVELHAGESIPSADSYESLVILGGPMAVYEMDRYAYLGREAKLIEDAVKAEKPVLGVCLGAQMLAHVLGGRVYAGKKKEIGWDDVTLTDEGLKDPCMKELAVGGGKTARVFQWHGDTFDLPDNAVRLASSGLYPNQAFRFGKAVYALQFHIEVTPRIVRDWLAHERGINVAAVDAESNRIYEAYRQRAVGFYRRFFGG